MAQTTAVIRQTVTATSGGTTDFTSSGFGTPSAAIFVASAANSTNNPQSLHALSVGIWDGTNQRCLSTNAQDNVSTMNTARLVSTTRGVVILNGTSIIAGFTVSNITDGVRLTMDDDSTTLQFHVTVTLIAGVSAKVLTFTPNGSVSGTATSASLGFAPTGLIVLGNGASGTAINDHTIGSIGVAEKDGGTNRCMFYCLPDSIASSAAYQRFSELYCCGQQFTSFSWAAEVTTWGSDSFTMTTRLASTFGDTVEVLALGGDALFDVGTLTSRTSTGTDAITTTTQPEALMIVAGTTPTTDTEESDDDAEGVSVGLSDGTNTYSHSVAFARNVGTSNAESASSATNIVSVSNATSSTVDALTVASVDSFNATDFTLNYTTAPSTATKGWWLAFRAAAAGAPTQTGNLMLLGVG